jgi:4-hydroxymandelate oxidase
VDIEALEREAQACADPLAWAYVAGGVGDGLTLAENRAAWHRWKLRPHLLVDVSEVVTATTVLGTPTASPVLVAPSAMHGLVCPERELATSRGAADAGAVLVLSQVATTSLEDVAAVAPDSPRWMQLYVQRDRGLTRAVCERAAAAGYRALVVTADSPVITRRSGIDRGEFGVPASMPLPNLAPGDPAPDLFALVEGYDPTLTPDDLPEISAWAGGLPVLVKGVVRGDDAARFVAAGAAGVVVSNHGGRQLDTCVATADVLPEVVDAVAGRGEVYVDGGVRRATDVLKALALGARAVLVGRPVVWALAVGGAPAVTELLDGLRADLATAMGLSGVTDVAAVPRDLVTHRPCSCPDH